MYVTVTPLGNHERDIAVQDNKQNVVYTPFVAFCPTNALPSKLTELIHATTLVYTAYTHRAQYSLFGSCSHCSSGIFVGSWWRSSMKLMAKLFSTHGHHHIELNCACPIHQQELNTTRFN